MADKSKNLSDHNGQKVISMKLFATWEVEKSSPNCIPRICSLRLTRLVVLKPLESELTSVIISVKMQSSKRVLRSNEIEVPSGGVSDVQLDLSFMLQYPHFLKREGNKLQVMLQRRKRYKNRPIIGYKTLAIGQLNMAQVLQHSESRELALFSDIKDHKNIVAKVMMVNISSSPVDHEESQNGRRKLTSSDVDRSPDVDGETDEDENEDYQENWSNDELSDSEPMMLDEGRQRTVTRTKVRPAINRQRNLKQKFVALLKRFKISEEVLDSEADHELGDGGNPADIDDLIEQLEDLSDSEPELDTMSVMSTPKPRLRPAVMSSQWVCSQRHGRSGVSTGMRKPGKQDRPFFTGRGSSNDIDKQSLSQEYPLRATASEESSNSQADHESDPEMSDAAMATSLEVPTLLESVKAEPLKGQKAVLASPSNLQKPIHRERSTSYKENKNRKEYKHLERCNSMGWVDQSGNSLQPKDYVWRLIADGFQNTLWQKEKLLPRKALLDQLSHVLGGADDKLPDTLLLVNTAEWQGQLLVQKLQEKQLRVICTCSDVDVRAAFNFLVSKIQKFCNCNSRSPPPVKIGISGGDAFINSVLRPYVEQFSAKSPDWQNYVRFLVIPFGNSSLGKHLSQIDATYHSLFNDSLWRDTFVDKTESVKLEAQEILNRVSKYMSSANNFTQIPIAEAMIMCKGRGTDDESSQVFIPFLSEIKIATSDVMSASIDLEEGTPVTTPTLSSSPPQSMSMSEKQVHTPPNSPNVGGTTILSQTPTSSSGISIASYMPREYVELQIDYWMIANKPDSTDKGDKSSKRDGNKSSLKSAFKMLQVTRQLSSSMSENQSVPFSMTAVMREKKQKIRIGKKSKEMESKSQIIEGISRLICTSKSQNHSLKVGVDCVDWIGVKFFQLSSQWQTHIKQFPVCVFNSDQGSNT